MATTQRFSGTITDTITRIHRPSIHRPHKLPHVHRLPEDVGAREGGVLQHSLERRAAAGPAACGAADRAPCGVVQVQSSRSSNG
jgi:hypothetical protein